MTQLSPPGMTLEFALIFRSILPYLIMVVVAPLTPHRPCETTSTTSFGAIVSTVSSKLVTLVLPSWKAPSAACGKRLSTLVRPVPQVQVSTSMPNYPLITLTYGPTAMPSGTFSVLSIYDLTVSSPFAITTTPIGLCFLTIT